VHITAVYVAVLILVLET